MKNKKDSRSMSPALQESLTKQNILSVCRRKLLSMTDLQKEMKIVYKNIFVHSQSLEKSGKILKISLDEQNNFTYIIPLVFYEKFSSIEEIEDILKIISPFLDEVQVYILISRNELNNELRYALEKNLINLIDKETDLKIEFISEKSSKKYKHYHLGGFFNSEKIKSLILLIIHNFCNCCKLFTCPISSLHSMYNSVTFLHLFNVFCVMYDASKILISLHIFLFILKTY